ncbi:glycosyltransferase family 4 protein, partial [Proteus mirabilis]|uniref:glycosyltransferase n=1 Tax=Proteus mirabilis TaxID=584 RepID=UPI00140F8F99
LLWSKGLGEVVEAIGKVKQNENNTTLYVAGILDDKDPYRIELDQILQWEKEGKIIWLGRRDDIQNLIRNSHVVI